MHHFIQAMFGFITFLLSDLLESVHLVMPELYSGTQGNCFMIYCASRSVEPHYRIGRDF